MADSITIFREPGTRYYSAVIDGRIIDSLGPDEMLAAIVHAILPVPPPYATPRSLQELRERERAATEASIRRDINAGLKPFVEPPTENPE